VVRLSTPQGAEARGEVALVHDYEAQVLIERLVPGHVDKGAERHSRHAPLGRPVFDLAEEPSAESLPLVVGVDADLLDMGEVVDDVDDDVANSMVAIVYGDPAAASPSVGHESAGGHGLGGGDVRHANFVEAGASNAFNGAQPLCVGRPSRADHACRAITCWRLTKALDSGIQQVVVVAAGYDSRAWRMARRGVTFFEVDLPATQTDKRSRAPDGGPVYVATDPTVPSLADKLIEAGFRPGEPVAFTVEGLTMYLTEDQVTGLLRTLAYLSGSGSRLAVNFGVGFECHGSRHGRIGRRVMAAGGEAFRFRLSPDDAPAFLTTAGWKVDNLLAGHGSETSTSARPGWPRSM
jgi:hypothetical protein